MEGVPSPGTDGPSRAPSSQALCVEPCLSAEYFPSRPYKRKPIEDASASDARHAVAHLRSAGSAAMNRMRSFQHTVQSRPSKYAAVLVEKSQACNWKRSGVLWMTLSPHRVQVSPVIDAHLPGPSSCTPSHHSAYSAPVE